MSLDAQTRGLQIFLRVRRKGALQRTQEEDEVIFVSNLNNNNNLKKKAVDSSLVPAPYLPHF